MPRHTLTSPPLAGLGFADLPEIVRRTMPFAQRLVWNGITDHDCDVSKSINQLLGHDWPNASDMDDEEYGSRMDAWTRAAYALGIAVGLHLRASVLDTEGGAR